MSHQSVDPKDIFNIKHLQIIQDEFATKMGVASIITYPNGLPVTAPSNFSRLCMNVIRNTPKGLANCMCSDAIIGRFNKDEPIIQPCLSGGLWDAGTSIGTGNIHIANWLIGQVMNETQDVRRMMDYAYKIGADPEEFSRALSSVTIMDQDKFVHISEALFLFARYLSEFAKSVLENNLLADDAGRDKLARIVEQEPDIAKLYATWDKMLDLFNYSAH
ncbi:MAG: PocR ligand-binding domain-containing protein [Thiotrichaceae bacterium]